MGLAVWTWVKRGAYYDSVTLMAVSQRLADHPGVGQVAAVMGTEANKEALARAGLFTPETAAARPADLVVVVAADRREDAEAALQAAQALLSPPEAGAGPGGAAAGSGGAGGVAPRTLKGALARQPAASLAFISVPGPYAAREARRALLAGLHVFLFSDHVPVQAEVELKELALERGLFMMGPGAGTAIVDGVRLGFTNAVGRGRIGIVAASGTGSQELSVLVDRLGEGVSHLLGVGGRDLTAPVGGRMTRLALERLLADPDTELVVVVAKPPDPEVAREIRRLAEGAGKPVLFCLLGPEHRQSLDWVAVEAVGRLRGEAAPQLLERLGHRPGQELPGPAPGRRYLRGLFAGGSLCEQALWVAEEQLGPVWCHLHSDPGRRVPPQVSREHTLVDLGDEAFTEGRPHPMIDGRLRVDRFMAEVDDPEVAVVLVDLVLGDGCHPDPAGQLVPAVRAASERGIVVCASVTGTDADPQGRSAQEASLRAAGAHVLPTAYLAARAAAAVAAAARRR